MSASQRFLCVFIPTYSSSLSSSLFNSRSFLFLRHRLPLPLPSSPITLGRSLRFAGSVSDSTMPRDQKRHEKPKQASPSMHGASAEVAEAVTSRLGSLTIAENSGQTYASVAPIQSGSVLQPNQIPVQGQKAIGKPKSYGTESRAEASTVENSTVGLSKLFRSSLLADFTVDNSTYSLAQIRATFYPKFENEKSDQEIRTRMIEMVSKGLATLEVSLKHSGSLFMYAGHEGGAYAKNSYGNIYTAVGVFVLGRMFREAWGNEAGKKQAEFNDFLERNRMCISMELVTAVLGDHGQRPREDYVVVTAVTELGNGKPKFYFNS
ncbi:hypothetical protein L1049_014306 [Liquidambar formosana]|uniref:Uncharacterized protein n=1 Tax=Liquidambar formosana TaxID=63359 RepID=A0AAP0RLR4_LIQFO